MAVLLVQHGKCLPKDIDPERSLSGEGVSEVEKIATVVRNHKVSVSVIAHSGKKRALQTAEIFAAALHPQEGVVTMDGLKPMDDVQTFAARLDNSKNTMFVGHLPFMEKLVSFLVAGKEDTGVLKFKNGGVVCLDYSDEKTWFIRWALVPELY